MINVNSHKGIVMRPMFSRSKDKEQFPNLKCRKCELTIKDYPYFKSGYEQYYHIVCALTVARLNIEDIQFISRKLDSTAKIAIETKYNLDSILQNYLEGDKIVSIKE